MEYLNTFILLSGCFVEVTIFNEFFGYIYKKKMIYEQKKNTITLNIVTTFLIFIMKLQANVQLNLTCVSIILLIYVFLLFECKFWNTILNYAIAIWILWGCELLLIILLKIPSFFLMETSRVELTDIPWQIFTVKLFTYIIFVIAKQLLYKFKRKLNSHIFFVYILISVSSLSIMMLTYFIPNTLINQMYIQIVLTLSFFFILLGNIFLYHVFNGYMEVMDSRLQDNILIDKLNVNLNYYKNIKTMNHIYKEFIHDTNHYLKTIEELIKSNNNKSINNVMSQINMKFESSIMTIYCENCVMNAVFNEKKNEAVRKGIIFDVYIEPGTIVEKMSDIDIITIFGNLLDNAILAAENSEKGHNIKVRIFMQNKGNFAVIKITNDFTGKVIINEKGFITTKKNKSTHGIGLQSVKNTIEKYNGYLECLAVNHAFTAILILPFDNYSN